MGILSGRESEGPVLRSGPMRPSQLPRLVLAGTVVSFVSAPSAPAASFPPELRFRTVETARVAVHYHQGLERQARQAATLATRILEAHETRYGHRVGKVQVVLADVDDDPNGFASPLPFPLVHLRAVAPSGADELGNYESWLRVLLTHELAHVVHLDLARGAPSFGRKVFGRAPFLFLNASTPTWMIEGLATYEETEGTGFGRGRNPDSQMVLRMAALDDDFPREDRPVLGLDSWPSGQAAYLFGEAFLRDLTRRFGADTLPRLAQVHAGRPVPYLDDLTAKSVTGSSFHTLWREWAAASRRQFEAIAEGRRQRGLTPLTSLTRAGVRQVGPRFSPDGSAVAYTSKTLTRFREIRLVGADGKGDHAVVMRNGGTGLAWTPDGRFLVYDEPDVHRAFRTRSDLRVVEVATGRVRRLTRGERAREPDVAPDGRTVVFVRLTAEKSELAVVGLDGSALREITRSGPGVQWSHPRWSPTGDRLVAARYSPGGLLDVVLVDPSSEQVSPLTLDRAKDVEPTFTPDGSHVVFRSDRDGISNLYAVRLEDRSLLRLTNVLGGAFLPDVAPDGRSVAFANYSSRGYDVVTTSLDLQGAPLAPPLSDEHPETEETPQAVSTPDRTYRAFPVALPRFWSPYLDTASRETRVGVATAGADPLLRHIYGATAYRGSETSAWSTRVYYQYDRFFPTFLLALQDQHDPGRNEAVIRGRELTLRASVPLHRTLRSAQTVSMAWRRVRETDTTSDDPFDLGGVEVAWAWTSAKKYPFSISPVDGSRLRVALLKEDPALGSEVSLVKAWVDGRAFLRLFGESDTLALRAGGGTTWGRPTFTKSYAVGGIESRSLFDVVLTNHSVLRGYGDDAFTGRSFAHANLEYRFPLVHPQRGFRSYPLFLRHVHGAVFFDAAHAWLGDFHVSDVKTSVGVALGVDAHVGHGLPVTFTAGVAHGLSERGETRGYVLAGLPF